MKTMFGPWSTGMSMGSRLELSSFWTRRMRLLRTLSRSEVGFTRRDWLRLAGVGLGAAAVPLVRSQVPAATEQQDAAARLDRIVFWSNGRLASIQPGGSGFTWHSEESSKERFLWAEFRLSPDGRRVAYGIKGFPEGVDPEEEFDESSRVHVRGLDGAASGVDLGIDGLIWCWSPDATKLAVAVAHVEARKLVRIENWQVDLKTKEKTPLNLPQGHLITDWSADGHWFLTFVPIDSVPPDPGRQLGLHIVKKDGSEIRALKGPESIANPGRFSPDGRKVLFKSCAQIEGSARAASSDDAPDRAPMTPVRPTRVPEHVFVMDLETGETRRVSQELDVDRMGACWSPDGKRIAYAWRQIHADPKPDKETESFLMVVDVDGKNPTTVFAQKIQSPDTIVLAAPDWR